MITHSDFCRRAVEETFRGLVFKIPLPYEPMKRDTTRPRSALQVGEDETLLVTVGHINPNKRTHSVLEALGRIPREHRHFVYAVIGQCEAEYRPKLEKLLRSTGLTDRVRLLGHADDEVLHAYLTHADICLNLRFPAFEGASASAIEQMWYGKAVIVTDTGFYKELPADVVCKVSRTQEEDDLDRALRELLSNREQREQLGIRAKAHAAEQFHARHYVQELLKSFDIFRHRKPALEFADRIAKEMLAMGIRTGMSAADTIASHAATLFFPECD